MSNGSVIPLHLYPDTLPRHFSVSRHFHPGYSLLGRWLQRSLKDRQQAESVYTLVLAGLLLAWILAQYVAWALLQSQITQDPTGSVALSFWVAQTGTLLVCGAVGMLGFKPGFHVLCRQEGLQLTQGQTTLYLPYTQITDIAVIPVLRFHRHERRYAQTRSFISRIPDTLLCLHTADGPVVIGLPEASHHQLYTFLLTRQALSAAAPTTHVA